MPHNISKTTPQFGTETFTVPWPEADCTYEEFVEYFGEEVVQQYAFDSMEIAARGKYTGLRTRKEHPYSPAEAREYMSTWKPKVKAEVKRLTPEQRKQREEFAKLAGQVSPEDLARALATLGITYHK